MEFKWYFEEEDFQEAQASTIEDEIYGFIDVITENGSYYLDIHKEYYSSKDNGYDIEVFALNDDGSHGIWYGSIHEIKSATTFERFKKRAEKLIAKFIMELN